MRVYAGKGGSAMLEMAAFEYSTEPGVYTIEHRTCTEFVIHGEGNDSCRWADSCYTGFG